MFIISFLGTLNWLLKVTQGPLNFNFKNENLPLVTGPVMAMAPTHWTTVFSLQIAPKRCFVKWVNQGSLRWKRGWQRGPFPLIETTLNKKWWTQIVIKWHRFFFGLTWIFYLWPFPKKSRSEKKTDRASRRVTHS